MARMDRGDKRIGNVERDHGLPKGSIRNPSGKDARSDKKLGTLRKDYNRGKKK